MARPSCPDLSEQAVSARRSAVGLLGSNTLFTGLKGYPAVLYTLRAARGRRHHEHSHSSLDLVYGWRRFPVGRKHAIHHRRYYPGFNYRSGRRGSPRNHVYAQSPTQAYLIAALSQSLSTSTTSGVSSSSMPGADLFSERVLPWRPFVEHLAVVSTLLAQAENQRRGKSQAAPRPQDPLAIGRPVPDIKQRKIG